jgi:hypothetical protein
MRDQAQKNCDLKPGKHHTTKKPGGENHQQGQGEHQSKRKIL